MDVERNSGFNGGDSGDRAVALGCADGHAGFVVSPLFDHFVGKPWESKGFALMERYYAAIEAVCARRSVGEVQGRNGCGFFAGVDRPDGRCDRGGKCFGGSTLGVAQVERDGVPLVCGRGSGDGQVVRSGTSAGGVGGTRSCEKQESEVAVPMVLSGEGDLSAWGGKAHQVSGAFDAVLRGPNGGVSYGRGPNYARNVEARKRRKEARKVGRSNATPCALPLDGTVEKGVSRDERGRVASVFFECDVETRRKLANSRAERYILENERAIERLKAINPEEERAKQKKRFETELKFLDGQLNGDYSLCPPGRVMGWAKTLVSKSSGSKSSSDKSSPSLSKGSTSPSSSVSQNERRLEKLCKELEQKLEASEKEKEKYKSQFKTVRQMTRPVMTDQDRYFGRDHDFESGNEDDGYYY